MLCILGGGDPTADLPPVRHPASRRVARPRRGPARHPADPGQVNVADCRLPDEEVSFVTTAEMQPITDWHRPLRDADFYTARSVDEALRLASEHAGRFIAGGTTLVRMERWGQRPAGPRLHRPDRGAEGGPRAGRANPVRQPGHPQPVPHRGGAGRPRSGAARRGPGDRRPGRPEPRHDRRQRLRQLGSRAAAAGARGAGPCPRPGWRGGDPAGRVLRRPGPAEDPTDRPDRRHRRCHRPPALGVPEGGAAAGGLTGDRRGRGGARPRRRYHP